MLEQVGVVVYYFKLVSVRYFAPHRILQIALGHARIGVVLYFLKLISYHEDDFDRHAQVGVVYFSLKLVSYHGDDLGMLKQVLYCIL
jgi:hypothetical protein